MSLTLARVFRTAYDLLADGFQQDKFLMEDSKMEKNMKDNVIHFEGKEKNHFDQVEATALLIDFNAELTQNKFGNWVRILYNLKSYII